MHSVPVRGVRALSRLRMHPVCGKGVRREGEGGPRLRPRRYRRGRSLPVRRGREVLRMPGGGPGGHLCGSGLRALGSCRTPFYGRSRGRLCPLVLKGVRGGRREGPGRPQGPGARPSPLVRGRGRVVLQASAVHDGRPAALQEPSHADMRRRKCRIRRGHGPGAHRGPCRRGSGIPLPGRLGLRHRPSSGVPGAGARDGRMLREAGLHRSGRRRALRPSSL